MAVGVVMAVTPVAVVGDCGNGFHAVRIFYLAPSPLIAPKELPLTPSRRRRM